MKEYIIQSEDVGQYHKVVPCKECGCPHIVPFAEVLGKVQDIDVGKRMVKKSNGLWYIENHEQYLTRRFM